MARLVESDGYGRSLIGNSFVAHESVRRRKERDRQDFRDAVVRHRGQDYLERFDDRSRSLDMDVLARLSLSIGRKTRSAFHDDRLLELIDIADTQHAPASMLDYLLSDRRLNYLARNQRIEAWGRDRDSYDEYNVDTNRFNPHYVAMNHGMMRASEEDDNDMVVENFLFLDNDDEIPHLSYDQRRALHLSRDMILDIFNEGMEDPTSRNNNLL